MDQCIKMYGNLHYIALGYIKMRTPVFPQLLREVKLVRLAGPFVYEWVCVTDNHAQTDDSWCHFTVGILDSVLA